MKKRPSLTLREPVKLYEARIVEKEIETEIPNNEIVTSIDTQFETKLQNSEIIKEEVVENIELPKKIQNKESVREKMSPRIQQIWGYFCKKAKVEGEINKSFNLTRAEVMKEANIGSTNTYRDALRKFQDLNLMEIELRPGVNSGSLFTLTEKGIDEIE